MLHDIPQINTAEPRTAFAFTASMYKKQFDL